jgi:large subunit ribosomal protein L24
MLIHTGDLVQIRTGNAKGTRAKVLSVQPEDGKILVEGVNRVYKHMKRSQKNPQGGRLSREMPISVSNVLIVCTACGKATRIGLRVDADGSKVRFCKKCSAAISQIRPARPVKTVAAT